MLALQPLQAPRSVSPLVQQRKVSQLLSQKRVYSHDQLQLSSQSKPTYDYEKIFDWVEKVTGKPIAYQNQQTKKAYIESLRLSKPQSHYDTKGFLASLGLHGSQSYGRGDLGIHHLVMSTGYIPNTQWVSKGLQALQLAFSGVFRKTPKLFFGIAKVVDLGVLMRKDLNQKPWLNQAIPQPIIPNLPLVSKEVLWQRYGQTKVGQMIQNGQSMPPLRDFFDQTFPVSTGQMSSQFARDFHMGVPKEGQSPQHYGTYALATHLGFNHDQAKTIGTADFDLDLNVTPYGKSNSFPNGQASRHFNLNMHAPEKGDTRFLWAERHLHSAVELAKRGLFEQAEKELGYGLHGIQDAFAHGHISMANHAVNEDIPDAVAYNPVAMVEASMATVGYLNKFVELLLKSP